MADGPCSRSSKAPTPASFAAILVSVFFTTAYDVSAPRDRRSSLSWATVSPRYSVRTAAVELRNSSVSSATAAALSGLAMGGRPPSVGSCRKGPGRAGRPGAKRSGASRSAARGCRSVVLVCTCAGRPPERDLRPRRPAGARRCGDRRSGVVLRRSAYAGPRARAKSSALELVRVEDPRGLGRDDRDLAAPVPVDPGHREETGRGGDVRAEAPRQPGRVQPHLVLQGGDPRVQHRLELVAGAALHLRRG